MLLYADDLIIIAESDEEMQRMLDSFSDWCAANNQDPNVKKTHMVHFDHSLAARKRRQAAQIAFTLPPLLPGGARIPIPEKDGYKYLGIWVEWSGQWEKHAKSRMAAAFTALGAAAPMGCQLGVLPMALILNLWQVMFEPILTSGLGVWGHDTKARKSIARATRAFLMRACRLDHSPPAGLLEVELGILSADGAWMKTLLTELHRLHMRRMGNALEPIHQANLAAESWADDGSWEGHGGAPPRLAGPSPLRSFESRALAAASVVPELAQYARRVDDYDGGPIVLALSVVKKSDWAKLVTAELRQWDLTRLFQVADGNPGGRVAVWREHCAMDVLPEGTLSLHHTPVLVSPVRLPHHYTAGLHAAGIAERLAWRVGGSCLLSHVGRHCGLAPGHRYCRLCDEGARLRAVENPLHLVSRCACPELGHAKLALAMATARTDAEAERAPLGGLERDRFYREAIEDWKKMRADDPSRALQLLLGTREATGQWLGDAEEARRHLASTENPSLTLGEAVAQTPVRQQLSAACGEFIRTAEELVSNRDPHDPPLGPDIGEDAFDMDDMSTDSDEYRAGRNGIEPRADDGAGNGSETLTSPPDSDEERNPPEWVGMLLER